MSVGRVRGAVRLVGWALAWAYALSALVKYLGFRASPAGLVGLCLVAAVLLRLVRTVAEPLPPLRLPSERPGGGPPDRPFERVDRIEDRLSWGGRAAHHFDAGVAPVLRGIAVDRLHRRHGVDLDKAPQAARQLLGEDLWQLLTAREAGGPGTTPVPRTTPPTPAEMERLVAQLESI